MVLCRQQFVCLNSCFHPTFLFLKIFSNYSGWIGSKCYTFIKTIFVTVSKLSSSKFGYKWVMGKMTFYALIFPADGEGTEVWQKCLGQHKIFFSISRVHVGSEKYTFCLWYNVFPFLYMLPKLGNLYLFFVFFLYFFCQKQKKLFFT